MTSNTPAQRYIFNSNAVGGNQSASPYALLALMAELDAELAKQATAVGVAVELLFSDDLGVSTIVAPQVIVPKTTP